MHAFVQSLYRLLTGYGEFESYSKSSGVLKKVILGFLINLIDKKAVRKKLILPGTNSRTVNTYSRFSSARLYSQFFSNRGPPGLDSSHV